VFSSDEDPRGIQVGTAITTLLKRHGHRRDKIGCVFFRDFWGRADAKRRALLESLAFISGRKKYPTASVKAPEGPRPYETLEPVASNGWKLIRGSTGEGFEAWPSLEELFPEKHQGVNPNRGIEGSIVEIVRDVLADRMNEYFSDMRYDLFASKHPVICQNYGGYEPREVRANLQGKCEYREDRIIPYLVFPFDMRWLYYETEGRLLNRRRPELWENREANEWLVAVPEPRRVSESWPLWSRCLFDLHLHDRGSVGFPAHVLPEPSSDQGDLYRGHLAGERRPGANLAAPMWEHLRAAWGLRGDLAGATAISFTRKLLRVCLALGHARQYQEDHADGLRQDWARVPIPRDRALFDALAQAGEHVATLLDPLAPARSVIAATIKEAVRSLAVLSRRGGGAVRKSDLVITASYFGAAPGRWVGREYEDGEPEIDALGDSTGDLFLNDEVFFPTASGSGWTQ
jgi:hypothetical protein